MSDAESKKMHTDEQKRQAMKAELLNIWNHIGPPNHGGFSEAWMGLNLTIAQFKCLVYLDKVGSTNQKTLAEVLGVTPPNITGILDRLVEQDLVSRHENETNRRMQVIELTPKSRKLLSELNTRRDEHVRIILDHLKVEDLAALVQGVKAIRDAAGELEDKLPPSFIQHHPPR